MIRTATQADLGPIQRLYEAWIAEDITWFVEVPALAEKLGPYFLVYELNGAIMGFVIGERKHHAFFFNEKPEDPLQILDLYVARSHRDAGIGTALMQALLAAAKANGVAHFTVHTANKNALETYRFYERFGFAPNWLEMFRLGEEE